MIKLDYSMVRDIFNKEGYELLSKNYNNANEKMDVRDNEGYKYYLTFGQFSRGNKPRRINIQNPFSIDNIKLWVKLNTIDYEVLSSEFNGTHKKLDFKCNHGHIFKMAWSDFQSGQRCSKCKGIKNAERCKHGYDEVKSYIESKQYSLLTKHYRNNEQRLLIKCDKNHVFEMNYNHFQRGQRCPYCNGSGGEIEIQNYLNKNQFKYKRECSFDDLAHKNKLRFDFAIFSKNELLCLIEFDGIQHFKPKNFGNISMEEAIEQLKITKLRDKLKNDYCKKKKINLIRIHYTQINEIEEILNKTIPR